MKTSVQMNIHKLVLVVLSFFIFIEGHSKLLSDFDHDYADGVSKSHSDFNVNPIYNFEKINGITYDISGRKVYNTYPTVNRSIFSEIEKNWNSILIPESAKVDPIAEIIEAESGSLIQIIAEPEIGYLFNRWTLNGVFLSSEIQYEFQMPSENASIIGYFDKVAPSIINIISPLENSSFTEGEKIDIAADIKIDIAEIIKVEFFIDGNFLGSSDIAPYKFTWENAIPGEYNIVVKATDNSGQVSTSSTRKFNVVAKANTSTSVSLTAPAADAQFTQGDNVSITANAADADGTISKVEFFNGNTLLGTDTTSPYSFAWTNAPLGSSSLTAKATNDKGTLTVSTSVNINVVMVGATPDPGSGTSLLEGLVAFYEMNTNLSGVLKDSHGQNNGTSTQISQVNGYNENGNRYDGISSVSSVPHSSILNLSTEFTWMADIFRQGDGQANSSIILGKTFSATWPENQTYSMAITKDNKIRIRTNSSGLQD